MGILIRLRGGSIKNGSGHRIFNNSARPSSSEREARKQLGELRDQLAALERQNEELKRIFDDLQAAPQRHPDLCERVPLAWTQFDPQEAVREADLLRRRPLAATEATGDSSVRAKAPRVRRRRRDVKVTAPAPSAMGATLCADLHVDPAGAAARRGLGDAIAGRKTETGPLGDMHEILERANRAARIGFWEIDFARSRTTWSTVTREIHEMPPDVEPDQTSAIAFHRQGATRERLQAAMDAAIANGDPYDLELLITTGRGQDRWIRTIGFSEMVDHKCLRLYGTVQDIDARVRAEEVRLAQVRAEAGYRLKAQFLSEMSDDLRTPLDAVLGFARLLAVDRDDPPSARQTTRLLCIQRAGTQLVKMIDDAITPSPE
jgi:PAS domain-containing protein